MILCPVCSRPIALDNKLLTAENDCAEQTVMCGTCRAVVRVEVKLLRATDLTAEELAKRINRPHA